MNIFISAEFEIPYCWITGQILSTFQNEEKRDEGLNTILISLT